MLYLQTEPVWWTWGYSLGWFHQRREWGWLCSYPLSRIIQNWKINLIHICKWCCLLHRPHFPAVHALVRAWKKKEKKKNSKPKKHHDQRFVANNASGSLCSLRGFGHFMTLLFSSKECRKEIGLFALYSDTKNLPAWKSERNCARFTACKIANLSQRFPTAIFYGIFCHWTHSSQVLFIQAQHAARELSSCRALHETTEDESGHWPHLSTNGRTRILSFIG